MLRALACGHHSYARMRDTEPDCRGGMFKGFSGLGPGVNAATWNIVGLPKMKTTFPVNPWQLPQGSAPWPVGEVSPGETAVWQE